jgi:hypothetical protein
MEEEEEEDDDTCVVASIKWNIKGR